MNAYCRWDDPDDDYCTGPRYTSEITTLILWIFFIGTFNFVYLDGRVGFNPRIKDPNKKYLFTSAILYKIKYQRIQVSDDMFIVINPRNFVPTKLNDFTVFWTNCAIHIPLFIQCFIAIWLTTCFVLFTHLPSFIFFLRILLFTKSKNMRRHLP